jgi:large subunit ribosomal protein L4
MRRRSIVATLSEKHRTGDLIVLEALTLGQFKTSELVKVLDALDAGPKPLLVADGAGALVLRSARNIPGVTTLPADRLYTLALLNHRKVIMTLDALRRVEELWGGGSGSRKSRSAQVGAQA